MYFTMTSSFLESFFSLLDFDRSSFTVTVCAGKADSSASTSFSVLMQWLDCKEWKVVWINRILRFRFKDMEFPSWSSVTIATRRACSACVMVSTGWFSCMPSTSLWNGIILNMDSQSNVYTQHKPNKFLSSKFLEKITDNCVWNYISNLSGNIVANDSGIWR